MNDLPARVHPASNLHDIHHLTSIAMRFLPSYHTSGFVVISF